MSPPLAPHAATLPKNHANPVPILPQSFFAIGESAASAQIARPPHHPCARTRSLRPEAARINVAVL